MPITKCWFGISEFLWLAAVSDFSDNLFKEACWGFPIINNYIKTTKFFTLGDQKSRNPCTLCKTRCSSASRTAGYLLSLCIFIWGRQNVRLLIYYTLNIMTFTTAAQWFYMFINVLFYICIWISINIDHGDIPTAMKRSKPTMDWSC